MIQEELEASKLQVTEIQQKYASQEAVISELTEELNLKKASESSTKESDKIKNPSWKKSKSNFMS